MWMAQKRSIATDKPLLSDSDNMICAIIDYHVLVYTIQANCAIREL